jgi:hypothetical protein
VKERDSRRRAGPGFERQAVSRAGARAGPRGG